MSASQELLSIADSLSVLSHSAEPVALRDDELAGLAFALRDLSIRVGYLETRRSGFPSGGAARRGAVSAAGAQVIAFPLQAQQAAEREDSAA